MVRTQQQISRGLGSLVAVAIVLAIVAACGPLGGDDEEKPDAGFTPEPMNEDRRRRATGR